ncbi:hypothetical protein K469DRAFT_745528 [Zopfia rhizophila CBS 207.26]|uniref:Uncharacterized protein n=1 Tax=Zopfia rhizophila CBS 207.26 TaxID=1314779 RepID=A0A6A6ETI2_9PEZI|nr:hypothetical protein K469DRAFT_745528 [Zopfia rhizophila CBS 207.26]
MGRKAHVPYNDLAGLMRHLTRPERHSTYRSKKLDWRIAEGIIRLGDDELVATWYEGQRRDNKQDVGRGCDQVEYEGSPGNSSDSVATATSFLGKTLPQTPRRSKTFDMTTTPRSSKPRKASRPYLIRTERKLVVQCGENNATAAEQNTRLFADSAIRIRNLGRDSSTAVAESSRSAVKSLRSVGSNPGHIAASFNWFLEGTLVDAIFPPGAPMSAVEILCFYPHHIRWPEVAMRLVNNNFNSLDMVEIELIEGTNSAGSGTVKSLRSNGQTLAVSQRAVFTPRLELNVLHTQELFRALQPRLQSVVTRNLDMIVLTEWKEDKKFPERDIREEGSRQTPPRHNGEFPMSPLITSFVARAPSFTLLGMMAVGLKFRVEKMGREQAERECPRTKKRVRDDENDTLDFQSKKPTRGSR